jgi:hypothetical protein
MNDYMDYVDREKMAKAEIDRIEKDKMLVICSCIIGDLNCPYCRGKGTVWVKVIGQSYQTE